MFKDFLGYLLTGLLYGVVASAMLSGLLLIVFVIHGQHSKPAPPVTKQVETTVLPVKKEALQTFNNTKQVYVMSVPQEQIVILSGEVGDNASLIASQINQKARRGLPIWLLISSPGGSIMDGAIIANAIEASPVPVYTVCIDMCASMASMIHQYGTERLMFDRSILMFHDAAGQFQGYFPHIRSLFNTVDRYVSRFNNYAAQRSGMTLAELELVEHTQLWVDAEDAIDRNMADKIVYISVIQNNKTVNLKQLMTPTTKPRAAIEPLKDATIFNVRW